MKSLRASIAVVCVAFAPQAVAADDLGPEGSPLEARGSFGPDGLPDPTYGAAGELPPQNGELIADGAILPDQRLVVTGTFASAGAHVAIRIVADSPSSISITQCDEGFLLLQSYVGRSVLAPLNGGVLVGGHTTLTGSGDQEVALLARFALPSCEFDESWSGSGWQLFDDAVFCDMEDCEIGALAESDQSSPRLFALLESHTNSLASRYFVLRFLASGELDTGYGDSGYAEVKATDLGNLAGGGAELDVDASGRAVVAATRFDPDAPLDLDPFLIRLGSGGGLDATFGTGGVRFFDGDDDVDHRSIAVALGADGTLWTAYRDATFGADPVSTYWRIPVSEPALSIFLPGDVRSIALQADDKLVAAYDIVSDGFRVARFRVDLLGGSLVADPEFGHGGLETVDLDYGGGDAESPVAVALSAGRPVVAGNADDDGGDGFFALRFRNRLIFVDGFETGNSTRWLTP